VEGWIWGRRWGVLGKPGGIALAASLEVGTVTGTVGLGCTAGPGNLDVDVVGSTDSLATDVMLMVVLIVIILIVVDVVLLSVWNGSRYTQRPG
jgi:hypothetical protein